MGKRVSMTFRIEEGLREALRKIAQQERRSSAWLVEEAVRLFVESYTAKAAKK